jgi:acyl-CoA thioesterase II
MASLDGLLRTLDLHEVGPDRYRVDLPGMTNGGGTLYGGQLMAQVVTAALRGQDGKRVKTLHTVFAWGGTPDLPVEIAVDRIHEGRSLASSTVTISQGGRVVTRSQALLSADDEDFLRHADPPPADMPPVPEPSPAAASMSPSSGAGAGAGGDGVPDGEGAGPWEVRIVGDVDMFDPELVGPPEVDVWTRFPGAPDDPGVHQALLAYGTDAFLIGTAMRPHPGVGLVQCHVVLQTGVLSHTLTYHEPVAVDRWFLLSHRSPYAGRGRSYGRADVRTPDGALVASFVQDGLIRPKRTS